MIAQRNLSAIANRLAENGGRRVPENVIERDYCISWFLVGLSRHPLPLAFKGGTALKRCYDLHYRFSEDLDFTLLKPLSREQISDGMDPIFKEVKQASGITFSLARHDDDAGDNTHT